MHLSAIPNLITLLRLLLIVPVALSILEQNFRLTLLLFAFASLSDGVDGFLARRFGWTSRFGAILDPIADKLLLVVVFLLLTYGGALPVWLAVVVIARDLVILTGATLYQILFGDYEIAPTLLGKLSTGLQFSLILATLLNLSFLALPAQLLDLLIWLVLIASSISGLDYIARWSLKAAAAARKS